MLKFFVSFVSNLFSYKNIYMHLLIFMSNDYD